MVLASLLKPSDILQEALLQHLRRKGQFGVYVFGVWGLGFKGSGLWGFGVSSVLAPDLLQKQVRNPEWELLPSKGVAEVCRMRVPSILGVY